MVSFSERTLYTYLVGDDAASVASKTKRADIPRDRWIQKIRERLIIQYDTKTTTPVLNEDNPMSFVNSLKVIAAGKDVLKSESFALRHYKCHYFYGTQPERTKTSTSTSQSNLKAYASCIYDFALDPNNPFDVSALLPAFGFSSLLHEAIFGADADVSSYYSQDFGYVQPTLREVEMTDDEAKAHFGSSWERLIKLYEVEQPAKTLVAKTDYGFQYDIEVGNIIRNFFLKVRDNSLRNDVLCSRYRIRQYSPKTLELVESDWMHSQITDKQEYGVENVDGAGVLVYKGLTFVVPEELGFFDTRGLKTGDLKLELTVGSVTGVADLTVVQEEIV